MLDEGNVKPREKLLKLRPTPGRLLVLLLAVEVVLLLSERFRWFPFNEKKGYTVLIAVAAVGVFLLVMLLWFAVALLFRRRFQFSIRSMLLLTIAVAVPCSWLAVEMKWAREQRQAVEAIQKTAGFVRYDYQNDKTGQFHPNAKPTTPQWLLKLLGDDFFNNVVLVDGEENDISNEELAYYLNTFPKLEWLAVKSNILTDQGLESLRLVPHLRGLTLSGAAISDGGMVYVKRLIQLCCLRLSDTNITDVGLKSLNGLPQLKELNLVNTKVTICGKQEIKKMLPNLEIIDSPPTPQVEAHFPFALIWAWCRYAIYVFPFI